MSLSVLGLLLGYGASFILFASRTFRTNLISLGTAYLAVFLLLFDSWALELIAIKLVGGWMAVAVLGASATPGIEERSTQDAGVFFRSLVFFLITLLAFSSTQGVQAWVTGNETELTFVAIIFGLSGFIRIGIVRAPIQVIFSILSIFLGFELVLSTVDRSALLTFLMAVVNLSLALIGAYLAASFETVVTEREVE